jgi:hypothetical protein
MGKFSRFLGKVSMKIGDEEITLNKMSVEDVQKLIDVSKTKENEIVNGVKVISDILSKSYSEEPKEELEAFVLKNYAQLSEEIIIALGWVSRDKLEQQKKELSVSEKKN